MSYQTDKNNAFVEIVYPYLLKNGFAKGELLSLEKENDKLSSMLDKFAGIDYVYKYSDNDKIVTFAARCQKMQVSGYNNKYEPYNTFSIRRKKDNNVTTEKEKRLMAIEEALVYPTHTIQAFLKDSLNGEVLSVAIIRTDELYSVYKKHPAIVSSNSARTGGDNNFFDVIHWSELKNYGYKIKIWDET